MRHQGIQVMGQDLPINCSVYALTSGTIIFQDFLNHSAYGNLSSFLPAYYITNCSTKLLAQYLSSFDINLTSQIVVESESSIYNQSGNGDTFVALLFTISGVCISSWMLTLLLYLSPKQKQKPILTHIATISFSIVSTILMTRLTEISSYQYYRDQLELVSLQSYIYTDNAYRVTAILSQLCIQMAWLQIVLFITRPRLKWPVFIVGSALIVAKTVVNIIYEVKYETKDAFLHFQIQGAAGTWRIVNVIIMLVMIGGFAVSLIYYTIIDKNPRKVSYSRRLLPLAAFNWVIFTIHIILNLFSVSLFRTRWQINTWLRLIPYFFDIVILTTVWEWIFNIAVLEKRFELVGILGRRISVDDVTSFDSKSKPTRSYAIYEEGANIFNMLRNLFKRGPIVLKDESAMQTLAMSTTTTKNQSLSSNSEQPFGENDQTTNILTTRPSPSPHTTPTEPHDIGIAETTPIPPNGHHGVHVVDANSLGESYDEEYIDYDWNDDDDDEDDEDGLDGNVNATPNPVDTANPSERPSSGSNDGPVESCSHQVPDDPPPFHVHPGFNIDDYWDDTKH